MNTRNLTAQVLILGLFHLSLVSGTSDLQAASPQPGLRQRVEQFGVGTELELKLRGGEKLRGRVESIGGDSFTLTAKNEEASREIVFNDLERVRYPKRGYKAEETPDAVAAKRMVVQLGVGEHIMVQVSPEKKVRGHIVRIGEEHFAILPDGAATTLEVPYSSIWKVNKNLSFGATVAILATIGVVAVLILVLSGKEEIDVLPN